MILAGVMEETNGLDTDFYLKPRSDIGADAEWRVKHFGFSFKSMREF